MADGPLGRLKAVVRRARRWLRPPPGIEATQAWLRLDLHSPERPHHALGPSFELREAVAADLPLLEQLPTDPSVSRPGMEQGADLMAGGSGLWLSMQGGRVAFCCWIFSGWVPIFSARGGGAALPPTAVLLDDALASPDFRGRGVAPASMAGIADRLAERGLDAVYTKVDITNAPSMKAMLKTGFREVGSMHLVRTRGRFTTTVALDGAASDGDRWLLELAQG